MPFLSSLSDCLYPYDERGPPPKRIPRRFPFYAFVFVSAFWQMFMAPIVAYRPGVPAYFCSAGAATSIVSAVTWILTAILMAYGHSSQDIQPIPMCSRCAFHAALFVLIAVVWLTLGAFFISVTNHECNYGQGCLAIAFCIALAFMTSIFALLSAAVVTCAVYASGMRWSTHVEKARHGAGHNTTTNERRLEEPSIPMTPMPPIRS